MKIELKNISKRYQYRYVFKNISFTFEEAGFYFIKGNNGSGKSTLLQIIAGILSPNSGEVLYTQNEKPIDRGSVSHQLSMAAPYLELIEEMNLREALQFHFAMRKPIAGNYLEIIQQALGYDEQKFIRSYSSGMKQKLKLVLALLTQSSLVLLDEPTANFDEQNMAWYSDFIKQHHYQRTIIIASPQPADIAMCSSGISLQTT